MRNAYIASDGAAMPVRVAVMDSCEVFRHAVCNALQQAGQSLCLVSSSPARPVCAVDVSRAKPDVVLYCSRSGQDLPALSKAMRQIPGARFVAFSFIDDGAAVVAALRAGAAGFIAKSARPNDLLSLLGQAGRGDFAVDPALAAKGLLWSTRPAAGGDGAAIAGLTRREREILARLAAGMCPAAIAAELVISKRTVEGHLAGVYRKLGVSGRIEAVRMQLAEPPVTTRR